MIGANEIGPDGDESEMFIKTEANGIVCKSNQQDFEEIPPTTLKYDDEYFNDDFCHVNTYDYKLDSENKIAIGQNKIKRFFKSIKYLGGNKDSVSKEASLRDRNMEASHTMINFGKKCESCLSTSIPTLDKDEIRCLNCFEFECLLCERQCSCRNTCYCKIIKKTIEQKLKIAKKTLRESINGRLPIEETINIVSTHGYNLHNGKTTLNLDLRLSRHFESQHKSILGNHIQILVLDYENPPSRKILRSRQAIFVILKTVVDEKVIGIYSKDMTARKEKFLNPLVRCLYSKDIHVENVNVFSGELGEKDAQLIIVCLVHSRVMSDVNAALCEIEDKLYKQIILVLLHFKQSDKRKCAHELKLDRRFSEMTIIDLFQQPESNNTDEVYEKIIDAINSYE